MSRTEKHAASATFNAVWQDADRPPWDVRGIDIEQRKIELLAPYLGPVRTVVDCACGGGDFLDMLAARSSFERVVGVDLAQKALERARRTGRYAELVEAHLEDAPRKVKGPFDLVLLGEVLQYVADFRGALAAVCDAFAAPGGLVFLAVAVGRKYMDEGDVAAMKALLGARGYELLEDRRFDYHLLGIPRRKLLFSYAYFQTHKAVLLYRRPNAA